MCRSNMCTPTGTLRFSFSLRGLNSSRVKETNCLCTNNTFPTYNIH